MSSGGGRPSAAEIKAEIARSTRIIEDLTKVAEEAEEAEVETMKEKRKINLAKSELVALPTREGAPNAPRKEADGKRVQSQSLLVASPKAKSKPTPRGSVGDTKEKEKEKDEAEEDSWGAWTTEGLKNTAAGDRTSQEGGKAWQGKKPKGGWSSKETENYRNNQWYQRVKKPWTSTYTAACRTWLAKPGHGPGEPHYNKNGM
jgi:hypothetical protein